MRKFSNFKMIRKTQSGIDQRLFATVDVSYGLMFWKKPETLEVCRQFGGYWVFTATGEFCPGFVVNALERSWEAKEAK